MMVKTGSVIFQYCHVHFCWSSRVP